MTVRNDNPHRHAFIDWTDERHCIRREILEPGQRKTFVVYGQVRVEGASPSIVVESAQCAIILRHYGRVGICSAHETTR